MHDLHSDYAVVELLVGRTLPDVERDLILATLRQTSGNRTQAANRLDIAVRTLRNKINLYQADGYDVPEPQPLAQ
ncbi:helix-turn-helix domain-containing protein [Bosea sp. NPDC055594]